MSQYVDSSALVKRYVAERDSDLARRLLATDTTWITGNHTFVEVHRALHRALDPRAFSRACEVFDRDWKKTHVVTLDDTLCRRAATIATMTGTRTLDAMHLAAVERVGGRAIRMLTFDLRQAAAARSLGFSVVGV